MPDQVPIYPRKAWTLLVFMAGDNDMESFAHLDLVEMRSLPSDEQVHVVVQFDSRSQATYRYRFVPGWYELVGEPLPEVNTGDPTILTEFVTWGKEHFPAERTALVIWNHGTGLRDLPADFDYSTLRSADAQVVKTELKRSLFAPTLTKLAKRRRRLRGVAVDATDRDYLDNKELKDALAAVPGDGCRVDLLGFDACLMNVVEIAYQLRGLAKFMVGSQETEPGEGWPYQKVVTELAARPDMDPGELAETLVLAYTTATKLRKPKESPYTQSALDLGQVNRTYELVSALAQKLLLPETWGHSTVQKALRDSRQEVKRFQDRDLADLGDWCTYLRRNTKGRAGEPFRAELVALQAHLELGQGLVVASQAHGGDDAARIHGVSIYWPQAAYSEVYEELDFAQAGWGQLVSRAVALR